MFVKLHVRDGWSGFVQELVDVDSIVRMREQGGCPEVLLPDKGGEWCWFQTREPVAQIVELIEAARRLR